jgi:hypothetical protein
MKRLKIKMLWPLQYGVGYLVPLSSGRESKCFHALAARDRLFASRLQGPAWSDCFYRQKRFHLILAAKLSRITYDIFRTMKK